MAAFDFKNAYRLAVQTNRELHMTLDSYKVMYENSQKEIEKLHKEITRLREQINHMRLEQAGIE